MKPKKSQRKRPGVLGVQKEQKSAGDSVKLERNKEELSSLEAEVKVLEDVLEAEVKRKDEAISSLVAKVKGLEKELKKKEETIFANVSRIEKLKPRHEEVDILRRVKKSLEWKEKALAEKEASLSSCADEISVLKIQVGASEKELRGNRKAISILVAKVKKFEVLLRKKEEIIFANASRIEKLKPRHEEVDILRRVKKSLEENDKALRQKEAELFKSADKISALKAGVKKLEGELKRKGIEELNVLRGVRKTIEEKDATLSESAERIPALEAKVRGLEEELRKKEEIISAKVSKIKEHKPRREGGDMLEKREKTLEGTEKALAEKEAGLSMSAEDISALRVKVRKFEEELKDREMEELNVLQGARETVEGRDIKLSEYAERISALEARAVEVEEELREKEKGLSQIKKEKDKHELLDQKTYPLVLGSINRKLKLATIEETATKKLLGQLAEQSSQIGEVEYKIKKRIHTEKLENISRNLAELKKLRTEISTARQG